MVSSPEAFVSKGIPTPHEIASTILLIGWIYFLCIFCCIADLPIPKVPALEEHERLSKYALSAIRSVDDQDTSLYSTENGTVFTPSPKHSPNARIRPSSAVVQSNSKSHHARRRAVERASAQVIIVSTPSMVDLEGAALIRSRVFGMLVDMCEEESLTNPTIGEVLSQWKETILPHLVMSPTGDHSYRMDSSMSSNTSVGGTSEREFIARVDKLERKLRSWLESNPLESGRDFISEATALSDFFSQCVVLEKKVLKPVARMQSQCWNRLLDLFERAVFEYKRASVARGEIEKIQEELEEERRQVKVLEADNAALTARADALSMSLLDSRKELKESLTSGVELEFVIQKKDNMITKLSKEIERLKAAEQDLHITRKLLEDSENEARKFRVLLERYNPSIANALTRKPQKDKSDDFSDTVSEEEEEDSGDGNGQTGESEEEDLHAMFATKNIADLTHKMDDIINSMEMSKSHQQRAIEQMSLYVGAVMGDASDVPLKDADSQYDHRDIVAPDERMIQATQRVEEAEAGEHEVQETRAAVRTFGPFRQYLLDVTPAQVPPTGKGISLTGIHRLLTPMIVYLGRLRKEEIVASWKLPRLVYTYFVQKYKNRETGETALREFVRCMGLYGPRSSRLANFDRLIGLFFLNNALPAYSREQQEVYYEVFSELSSTPAGVSEDEEGNLWTPVEKALQTIGSCLGDEIADLRQNFVDAVEAMPQEMWTDTGAPVAKINLESFLSGLMDVIAVMEERKRKVVEEVCLESLQDPTHRMLQRKNKADGEKETPADERELECEIIYSYEVWENTVMQLYNGELKDTLAAASFSEACLREMSYGASVEAFLFSMVQTLPTSAVLKAAIPA